ncbi:hypothetical protein TWF730_000015 [Orbilia blumenaviensis]|uniref:Uncharacterized protein n=1 Tax=Orbilia blumenaviensis TaxID=1796055 RepID=A0AAV9VMC7_9PEZI
MFLSAVSHADYPALLQLVHRFEVNINVLMCTLYVDSYGDNLGRLARSPSAELQGPLQKLHGIKRSSSSSGNLSYYWTVLLSSHTWLSIPKRKDEPLIQDTDTGGIGLYQSV